MGRLEECSVGDGVAHVDDNDVDDVDAILLAWVEAHRGEGWVVLGNELTA